MFFSPRYLKEGRVVARNAAKMLRYKRDLLSAAQQAELQEAIDGLHQALSARDRARVESAVKNVEERFHRTFPVRGDAGWRENCEVFLVAIVIALAVRSYFLQPFTIPTGSMQPTLNGVIGHPTESEPPNILTRAVHFAVFGRSYVNVVSEQPDRILELRERKFLRFFPFTTILCERQQLRVYGQADILRSDFGVTPGRPLEAGEIIARGYIETGDHVFVDKFSYHFRQPKRGEVFVFKTTGIARIERRFTAPGSQYYIKRLVGTPGDALRIDPPVLHVNGEPATEAGIKRVGDAADGYGGYATRIEGGGPGTVLYLRHGQDQYVVPENQYFALGDNSLHSFDSRGWGTVPERNLVGPGFFVYWPFTRHWGLIE